MKGKVLDWTHLGWKKFQKLSLYLAQGLLPTLRFEEYLKQGNYQAGIDLICTLKNGYYTVIQCKDEDLPPSKLESLVQEFKDGNFYAETSHFILATTSDLQTEPRKNCIKKLTENLAQDQIQFEVWDVTFLEDQLKNYFSLVADFFSLYIAKEHCFLQKKNRNKEISDFGESYVPRTLVPEDKERIYGSPNWNWIKEEKLNLKEFLISERFPSHTICLIGDPYQGKSSFLKQTAYELRNLENPFVPIFIDLKAHVLQSIEIILNQYEGAWQSTPIHDLILFIDGLDEVPTDRFNDAVGYIREFSDNYPNLTIIFSCRKLFYHHYSIESKLTKFKAYELSELTWSDVETYLQKSLKKSYSRFLEEVKKLNLENLLFEPFYLTELIKSYKISPSKLATSKAKLIESFIQSSIEKSNLRKLSKGQDLKHKQVTYNVTIQKLAFTLQVLGSNSLKEEVMQSLFTDTELELLQHSSLVSLSNNQWFFTSSLFQEYLAARVLLQMEFDQVISLVTIGEKITKIKAKWIQTYGTLLALIEQRDPKWKRYIAVMEADNIELIFDTDRSKFDEKFRLYVLKKLIERNMSKNMRTLIVYENKIGSFIGSDEKCMKYLIQVLSKNEVSDIVKITVYKIIKYARPSHELLPKIEKICLKEISQTSSPTVAACCIIILSDFNLINEKTALFLVENVNLNLHHVYRQEVYRYLSLGKFADRYYSYGLQGISFLIEYNEETNYHDSESSLLTFLLETKKSDHVRALLRLIQKPEWVRFFEYKTEEILTFTKRLIEISVQIYAFDSEIFFHLVEYIRLLDRHYLITELVELIPFFERTNTSSLVVEILHKEILGSEGYIYGGLLTERTIPYILFEMEEGNYKTSDLWGCIYGLNRVDKSEVAEILLKIHNELSILEKPVTPEDGIDKWQEFEDLKYRNDILHFQSSEKLADSLKKYFQSYGKNEISRNEIYIDIDNSSIPMQVYSNLMQKLLLRCLNENKKTTLTKCLSVIQNENTFNYFRINEGIDLLNEQNSAFFKPVFESYYHEEIQYAKFENCYHQVDGKWLKRKKEELLCKLFLKFRFKTADPILLGLIWMDKGGVRNLKPNGNEHSKTLTDLIIQDLGTENLHLLRDEVLLNMETGIFHKDVFGNHAALCHYFKIEEAKEIIISRILSKEIDSFDIPDLSKFYLELGGNSKKLIPVLRSLSHSQYLFIPMVDLLINYLPREMKKTLTSCMNQKTESNELQIQAAIRLSNLGDFDGFSFLVEEIIRQGKSPIAIQGIFTIKYQDTLKALNKLMAVSHHILDDIGGTFHESARSIILEWIYCLAGKSEKDLELVVNFLKEARRLHFMHPLSDHFYFYAERCIENFRDDGITNYDIKKLQNLYKELQFLTLENKI